tara:strand:- start:123 stop:458 length:336 start_codon:yes stop_codon:yes gene_type:complete
MLDLSKYETTVKGESSLYKGIPIVYRYHPLVRELMKTRLFSVKYRGCSKEGYSRPQNGCHKEYADTFAIYPYSNYPEYEEIRKGYTALGYGYSFIHDMLKLKAKRIVDEGL